MILLDYNISLGKDYFFIYLYEENNYFSELLLSNIKKDPKICDYISKYFVPIFIKSNDPLTTGFLNLMNYHLYPFDIYFLTENSLNKISKKRLMPDDLIFLLHKVNQSYSNTHDFYNKVESEIGKKNTIYYKILLLNNAIIEKGIRSIFLKDVFGDAFSPQIIIMDKNEQTVKVIYGYLNNIYLYIDLEEVINKE
jgi:hypothetical protein